MWKALTSARQRLANIVVRGPSDQQQEQYLELVEDARREKEIAERALAERSAAFTAELARTEIGLPQVQAALPPASALVSFVRYDRTLSPRPHRCHQRQRHAPPRRFPRTSRSCFDPANRSRLQFPWETQRPSTRSLPDGAPRPPPGRPKEPLRATGATLRQRVWDPIAKQLQDVSRVFVVPDGASISSRWPLSRSAIPSTFSKRDRSSTTSRRSETSCRLVMPSPLAAVCWRSADRRSKKRPCLRHWRNQLHRALNHHRWRCQRSSAVSAQGAARLNRCNSRRCLLLNAKQMKWLVSGRSFNRGQQSASTGRKFSSAAPRTKAASSSWGREVASCILRHTASFLEMPVRLGSTACGP